ncbi:hypothetical protein CSB45_02460 [candidate division KSB3 bacterium]|uniref:Uncharacterized protein n=1 Tax=candidate division KSB3 bacterium TaxID=2044937 RepID=A0A2G6EAT6_9BACT|nr:MAG: hypothetical protein CSB45_02460 [candidate division KSB3 bacterium]
MTPCTIVVVVRFSAKVVWRQELPDDESVRYDGALQYPDVLAKQVDCLTHNLKDNTEINDEYLRAPHSQYKPVWVRPEPS